MKSEIIDVVNRIAVMADRRDWQACQEAFSERVETDYTSLNGGQPATVNANDLVNGWNAFFAKTFKPPSISLVVMSSLSLVTLLFAFPTFTRIMFTWMERKKPGH
jgi:hypothetical protein